MYSYITGLKPCACCRYVQQGLTLYFLVRVNPSRLRRLTLVTLPFGYTVHWEVHRVQTPRTADELPRPGVPLTFAAGLGTELD